MGFFRDTHWAARSDATAQQFFRCGAVGSPTPPPSVLCEQHILDMVYGLFLVSGCVVASGFDRGQAVVRLTVGYGLVVTVIASWAASTRPAKSSTFTAAQLVTGGASNVCGSLSRGAAGYRSRCGSCTCWRPAGCRCSCASHDRRLQALQRHDRIAPCKTSSSCRGRRRKCYCACRLASSIQNHARLRCSRKVVLIRRLAWPTAKRPRV